MAIPTNEYTWTSDDIKLVEKFIEIKKRGYYVSGEELTAVYNRVLNKRVNTTNCSSCLSQRVRELEAALNRFKSKIENNAQNVQIQPSEPQTKDDEVKDRMAKVRAARKLKKDNVSEES